MAGGAQESDDAIVGINVTPLVDIFLVVLIIFMVTAKNLMNDSKVPLDLPKAATGSEQVQTIFSVVLAADGSVHVDSNTLPNDDAVFALAKDAHKANPELRAVIKADNAVPHGRVIHVLDLLKQAQIGKIAFGVSPVAPVPGGVGPGATPAPPPAPTPNP